MKSLIIAISVALAFTAPGAVENTYSGTEDGENGLCLDYNVLYEIPGVHEAAYEVQGGTNFTASHEGGAVLWIDWYNADGASIGYTDAPSGSIPGSAALATFCVGAIGSYPDVPAVGATWSFTDGLA